jgi:uncharacterized protein (TIGR01777 family)
MKVVIAGGTGFIGRALTKNLIDSGEKVVILTRDPYKARISGNAKAIYEKWDARTVSSWTEHINDANAVINLAGEPLAGKRWTKFQKEWILNSRTESTSAIVEAISDSRNKPSVLINGSAVGYYGDVKSGDVDESYPAGNDFLAKVCVDWEAAAAKAEEFGVRTVMIRTGVALEKDGGVLKLMLSTFKMYAGGIPGSGGQWVPWIHREDAVRAVLFLLDNNKLSGPVNLTSPNPVTMRELISAMGRILDKPMLAPVPAFLLKAVLGEMADIILTGQKAVPRKLLESGFKFSYPDLEEALLTILE